MNIYQGLYDLINQYVFNNTIVVGTHQDLVCIMLSTIGWVFLTLLPFLIVWRFIKMIG